LIHVFLEDRPVVVLDEWAADQDPTFRRVFYEQLLPEMKRHGKTLIVISHDDAYFHVADRVIEMDAGRIIERRLSVDASLGSSSPSDVDKCGPSSGLS
jgi:putative ATP-binding cassette transporter